MLDIVATDGGALLDRLVEQGISADEVILKYCWRRYAPPPGTGLRSLVKSENLVLQFERLIAMHREAPSSFPMPVATVRSPDGAFAGYLMEYVGGETLRALIAAGMLQEAGRQLDLVEAVVRKLHGKAMPHGDINPSNVIAADDGRTVLLDPVASPGPGLELQDRICIDEIRQQIEEALALQAAG
jgi:aminoglycoside phosphotransferase (APT) family kinase protein